MGHGAGPTIAGMPDPAERMREARRRQRHAHDQYEAARRRMAAQGEQGDDVEHLAQLRRAMETADDEMARLRPQAPSPADGDGASSPSGAPTVGRPMTPDVSN